MSSEASLTATLPGGFSTEQALGVLQSLLFPDYGECVEYLYGHIDSAHILKLYKHLFPDQYKASRVSAAMPDEGGYSRREMEFFEMVDAKLFRMAPIWDEHDRYGSIPYQSLSVEPWDDRDNLRPAVRFAIALSAPEEDDVLPNLLPPEVRDLCPPLEVGVCFDAKFQRLCRHAGGAARDFPYLVKLVEHNTDNFLLDLYEDGGYEQIEWSIANVCELARLTRQAERYWARVDRLCERLEKNPRIYLQFIELWNASTVSRAKWEEHVQKFEARRRKRYGQ